MATNAGVDVSEEEPYTLLMGMQTSVAILETSIEVPQKAKMELLYDSAKPLLLYT